MTALLSPSQLGSIRALGESGMTVDVLIHKVGRTTSFDDSNPFGDDTLTESPTGTDVTVKGWVVSLLGRDFDSDGQRIVAVGDFILRVPVGTDIAVRDVVTIDGTEYTVMETNTEDTWAEWTVANIKKVS
jgi:hypothetical protein